MNSRNTKLSDGIPPKIEKELPIIGEIKDKAARLTPENILPSGKLNPDDSELLSVLNRISSKFGIARLAKSYSDEYRRYKKSHGKLQEIFVHLHSMEKALLKWGLIYRKAFLSFIQQSVSNQVLVSALDAHNHALGITIKAISDEKSEVSEKGKGSKIK